MPSYLCFGLVTLLLFSVGCGRYYGHDDFYYFWRDFDAVHLAAADADHDGTVTVEEAETERTRWFRKHGYIRRDGRWELFDTDGRRVSPEHLVALGAMSPTQ